MIFSANLTIIGVTETEHSRLSWLDGDILVSEQWRCVWRGHGSLWCSCK